MKPYFVKWRVVKGEIALWDYYFQTDYAPTQLGMATDQEALENGFYTRYPKVKAFLCAKEVRPGDKFDSANGTGFICSKTDLDKVYSIGGLHSDFEEVPHSKEYSYRVIGEISPAAFNWVRDGNELDEDEIRKIEVPRGRFHFDQLITIKGSCGHFH